MKMLDWLDTLIAAVSPEGKGETPRDTTRDDSAGRSQPLVAVVSHLSRLSHVGNDEKQIPTSGTGGGGAKELPRVLCMDCRHCDWRPTERPDGWCAVYREPIYVAFPNFCEEFESRFVPRREAVRVECAGCAFFVASATASGGIGTCSSGAWVSSRSAMDGRPLPAYPAARRLCESFSPAC